MRREPQKWEYSRGTSFYNSDDYRSKFYKGKWEKAWIKDRIQYAITDRINLFEALWDGYTDKMEHIPKSLFKFYPFNQNSLKCLEANEVFMNDPNNFNDPFDCVLCANKMEYLKQSLVEYLSETDAVNRGILSLEELNKLKNSHCGSGERENVYSTFNSVVSHICYDAALREFRKGSDEIGEALHSFAIKYQQRMKELRKSVVRITSFSDINKFKLTSYMELWSHYAQNHEGFCIEYDLTKSIMDNKENAMVLGGLLPCEYGARQVVLSKRKVYKYVNKIPFTAYEQMEFEKSILLSFLTKSSSWKYENEWRLLIPVDICKIYGNMIPFFPIKAIYIGCRMPIDNQEYLYRFAQRKNIDIYNMTMHEYNFELEGDYSNKNIDEYFERKYEKRQRNLRDSRYKFWKY